MTTRKGMSRYVPTLSLPQTMLDSIIVAHSLGYHLYLD